MPTDNPTPEQLQQLRTRSHRATAAAAAAWAAAPIHHRAMAGPLVGPMLEAIAAINAELAALQRPAAL